MINSLQISCPLTLLGDGRQWVGSRSSGDVLEVGIGTGRNLADYPADARVTGIDISSEMLARARARAAELGRSAELSVGNAERLAFPDERFDTVVFSLSLCSIPDYSAAIREAKRVLRPGGRLVVLEHVRSPSRAVRAVQRVIDWFTTRLQGDHMLRVPLAHLHAEGFRVEEVERSKLGIIERAAARKSGKGP